MGWRRAVTPLALAASLVGTASAQAAHLLVIDGAGDGHGVGMSQTGAEGLALHGYSAAQILSHYYTGTALGTVAPGQMISVLLQSGLKSTVFTGASHAGARRLSPALVYIATAAGAGQIALESEHGRPLATLPTPLVISGPAPLTLDGGASNGIVNGRYRGRFEIDSTGRRLDVVNLVRLESYLRGVVPAESPSSWPVAELQAQAIAARTYAVTSTPRSAFDLYADSRSQQYDGMSAESAAADAAVAATAGEVVTYQGQPVPTYYFASSGGETEDIQNAFIGAAAQPWLQAVADPFDTSRFGPVTLSLRAATAKLGGLLHGTLESIAVVRRGVSPRIVTAEIVGSRGTTSVSGPTLAGALGMASTWLCFTVTPASGVAAAGWDRPCRTPTTGTTGPTGVSGPTGPTGASGTGGAVAPGGGSGPTGSTAATGSSSATGQTGSTTGGTVAPS